MKCKIYLCNFSLQQLGSSIKSTMSLLGISSEYYYRNKYNMYHLLAAKKILLQKETKLQTLTQLLLIKPSQIKHTRYLILLFAFSDIYPMKKGK